MRRASLSNGRKMQNGKWEDFKQFNASFHSLCSGVDLSQEQKKTGASEIYFNNRYIVFVYFRARKNKQTYTKAMCRRCDGRPICSWGDLFRIKNELFGDETEALQFLPKKSELVDQANLYWFFIPSDD